MSGSFDSTSDGQMREGNLRRLVAVGPDAELPARRRIRVLCVEDDPEDVFLLDRYLKGLALHEAEVVFAASLGEAREHIQAARFDVCLCDFWLGCETTMPLIDEIRLSLGGCPIVLMSSLDNEDIELIGRRSGTCGFIGKADLSSASLDRILATILPRRAAVVSDESEDEVQTWLRALLASLDKIHAASSLALVDPGGGLDHLAEQLLGDIEADSSEIRQDIVAKLLAFEKAARSRARHALFDVVPGIVDVVDQLTPRLDGRSRGEMHFLVPRMPIRVEGAPELFADLLQGFLAERSTWRSPASTSPSSRRSGR
ncbi:response regulator [Methylobrevis pamukkalensis]|uniref:DNA-binding transcriptional regulator RstA n=1 Tax=Methylobrevis pamukkalensis TaxID=1439726 RepID=A0A1E3H0I3_9HYPH|nr:response regulator [Methylobrevis pamukkalensis]ODN69817.1 DNA-binding transcriptional regulator RstA [Methylobrevis pamukkalensis]